MANTIRKADFQDAVDVASCTIMVNGVEWGFVTGLTVDGKSPEDLINCISGTLRRRKPLTVERSVDAAVLYSNIGDLKKLTGGYDPATTSVTPAVLFQIIVTFENPDKTNPDNLGQILTINECRIQDHTINVTESSTYKFSGKAKNWTVTTK